MSEEIINKLNALAVQRNVMTETFAKSIEENENNAAKLVAELNGIKVGDFIEVKNGKGKAIIRKIQSAYSSFPYYSTKPFLIVSFLKKDGLPRAWNNRIWGEWSKVND